MCGVRGDVTSPTFVIARVHPSTVGGPALVHVDAYRLGSLAEVDDLGLDASMDESVTVYKTSCPLMGEIFLPSSPFTPLISATEPSSP